MTWQPLVSPEEAGHVVAVAEEIAGELRRWLGSPAAREPLPMGRARFSLSGGWAGQALFFAYLDRARPGEGYDEVAAELLERAFADLGEVNAEPGLFAGFTGLAWTVEHLREALVEPGEDPGEGIAERLAALLTLQPWPMDYDLISGLAGFGVYAVERLPHPWSEECVRRTVTRLSELAERGPEGISWWTVEASATPSMRMGAAEGHYNLGTAHGVPGVIGWLGQACASGAAGEEARELLAGAVSWLLKRQGPPESPSLFPTAFIPGQPGEPCRLAWCYGDLGIAAALLTAAKGAGEPEWEKAALEIARHGARRSPETAGVTEAGLCHGAAGNAHLFNRLWQATGDPALAEAARLWLSRALERRRPGEGLAGFLTYIPDANRERGWRVDPGFLTGAAGIGLALLAAATAVEPSWDRLLLVSCS